jgi:hypothetical protein
MRKIAIALLLVLSASLAAGKVNTNKHANTQQTNTAKQPKQTKDKAVTGMTTHGGSKGYGVTGTKSNDSKNVSDGAAKGQASEGTAPRNSGNGRGGAELNDSKNISDGAAKGQASEGVFKPHDTSSPSATILDPVSNAVHDTAAAGPSHSGTPNSTMIHKEQRKADKRARKEQKRY